MAIFSWQSSVGSLQYQSSMVPTANYQLNAQLHMLLQPADLIVGSLQLAVCSIKAVWCQLLTANC
jgi:hypothetical protein